MTYCVSLEPCLDPSTVGAKAANLGRVMALGQRVPPGFVVTRDALTLFLEETGLTERVQDYLEEGSQRGRGPRMRAFEELRSALFAAQIPAVLRNEVTRKAHELLESAPVGLAVRSSSVGEDTEATSFAGVYESFLGIHTTDKLWKSIRECWCSSWAPQAMAYMAARSITPKQNRMAVLVQALVPAKSAGVIFTADPISGNPWRFVLNSTFGLASGLLRGSAPADMFALEWDTGETLETQVADKPIALLAKPHGLEEVVLPEQKATTASLSEKIAGRIGAMALDLDRAFGQRLDVEWAIVGDGIHVVQVRPITALPTFFPHELSGGDADLTWILSDPAWHTSMTESEQLVAPLFRDVWFLEQWERHLPPDFFPRRDGKQRDFNGYRYTSEWTWKTCGHDYESHIRWLTEHEHEIRELWTRQTEAMRRECEEIAEAPESAPG